MWKKAGSVLLPVMAFGGIMFGGVAHAEIPPTPGPIWPNDCIRMGGSPNFDAPQSPPGQAWYGTCSGGRFDGYLLKRA
ncbi:hypothetical protein [Nocardia sp. NPDC003345]